MPTGLRNFKRTILLGVLFVCFVAFILSLALPFLAEQSVALVPEEMEYALGRSYFVQNWSNAKLNQDSVTAHIIHKCARVASKFEPYSRIPIQIAVVEDSSVCNAFALPGGIIVMYRGILDIMSDQNELMALLAHEAGHVYSRHGLQRLVRGAFMGFAVGVLTRNGDHVFRSLLNESGLLLSLAYDRAEEEEADEFALRALARANLNPEGLLTLFEKLREQRRREPPAFLSTHPAIAARIDRIRESMRPSARYNSVLTPEEWQRLKIPSPQAGGGSEGSRNR